MSSFISACEAEGSPIIYVSFNRSPQTITKDHAALMSPGRFELIDCFLLGKGNGDAMFPRVLQARPNGKRTSKPVHVENPAGTPIGFLTSSRASAREGSRPDTSRQPDRHVPICGRGGPRSSASRTSLPRLCDLEHGGLLVARDGGTLARVPGKIRHITRWSSTLAVFQRPCARNRFKAPVNRRSLDFGVMQRFRGCRGRDRHRSRVSEDRELTCLRRLGGSAPAARSNQVSSLNRHGRSGGELAWCAEHSSYRRGVPTGCGCAAAPRAHREERA